jgi:hypothetical protein
MAHTAPIDKNLFTFNHVFLVEVSNQSRHPRASVPELRGILHPADATDRKLEDRVGHWWEAQLLHYGLRPSKTKAVAKTRLLDVLNHGTLEVPRDIVKLEVELKKKWAKGARGAKKNIEEDHPTTLKAAAKGKKRKTQHDEVAAAPAPVKKSKAAATPSKAPKAKATSTKPIPTSSGTPKATSTKSKTPKAAAVKSESSRETIRHSQPKQTAKKSGGSQALGLLNGRYDIDCPGLEDWGYSSANFSLILTLEGESLWGAYDFGMYEGIFLVPHRPYTASEDRFEFNWRGRENGEGETSFGPWNEGWLEFVGGGRIRGMINCYGEALFEGQRVSGDQTRSERDARSMRHEWEGYNQDNYDRANRARWGGSGW